MPRKRKRRRRLNMYQVYGLHLLIYAVAVAALVLRAWTFGEPVSIVASSENIGPPLSFTLFSLWIVSFYFHTGYVVLITIYRLLRRWLYDQPAQERLRDEKINRLLDEVAELREAMRGTGLVYVSSNSEGRTEGLVEKPSRTCGELDFAEEAETEAEIRLN